jgi:hypothetical protein
MLQISTTTDLNFVGVWNPPTNRMEHLDLRNNTIEEDETDRVLVVSNTGSP